MGQYAIIAFIFFLYIFFAKPWGLSFVCVTCGELRGEFAIIIIWLLHLAKQSTRGLRSVDFVNISPPTQMPLQCSLCSLSTAPDSRNLEWSQCIDGCATAPSSLG